MTNREIWKDFLWNVMLKPIPKLIAAYWATMISTMGLIVGIAFCIEKIGKK